MVLALYTILSSIILVDWICKRNLAPKKLCWGSTVEHISADRRNIWVNFCHIFEISVISGFLLTTTVVKAYFYMHRAFFDGLVY